MFIKYIRWGLNHFSTVIFAYRVYYLMIRPLFYCYITNALYNKYITIIGYLVPHDLVDSVDQFYAYVT